MSAADSGGHATAAFQAEQPLGRRGVLYDQSHHMHNIFISAPDALKLITDTGINSTAKFPVDAAKQFVPVSPEGGVIGDLGGGR